MAQVPSWAKDPNAAVPKKFKDLMGKYPELVSAMQEDRVSIVDLVESMGISNYAAATLKRAILSRNGKKRRPAQDPNENFNVTKRGPIPLPSLRSWDREAEILPKGLSWEAEEEPSIKDLIDRRTAVFNDLHHRKEANKVTRIDVKLHGPIAITHLGDPHVDADGCNWPELIKTIETISKTEGMYAGNIGDTTNNWVGSLKRLYAHQSTTYDEGVRLAEWLLTSYWATTMAGMRAAHLSVKY